MPCGNDDQAVPLEPLCFRFCYTIVIMTLNPKLVLDLPVYMRIGLRQGTGFPRDLFFLGITRSIPVTKRAVRFS